MNALHTLKKIRSIKKVLNEANLRLDQKPNYIFFICPRMKSPGIVLGNGFLTCTYVPGLTGFAESRIALARTFIRETLALGIDCDATAIYADADAFVLFPQPANRAPETPSIPDIRVQSNFEAYQAEISTHSELCETAPWQNLPIRTLEEQRLKKLLPDSTPRVLKEEFVRRTFAGFALDGLVIRKHRAFPNPVLLGVESPGVAILQNAALEGKDKIPVVELR